MVAERWMLNKEDEAKKTYESVEQNYIVLLNGNFYGTVSYLINTFRQTALHPLLPLHKNNHIFIKIIIS